MRLDQLLVLRGHAETRSKAQDLIRRGMVRTGSKIATKTGIKVSIDEIVEVLEPVHYVARSARKLIAALDSFRLSPGGVVCLDVGASSGGFTQVLLERGASKVYAVDVGSGQLHEALRKDPRVVSLERTDARSLTASVFAAPPQAITFDLSFISILKVLPGVLQLAALEAWTVVLVKPQFEVGRSFIGKKGIVKDERARQAAIKRVVEAIEEMGWRVIGAIPSPLPGQGGNEETLVAAVHRPQRMD